LIDNYETGLSDLVDATGAQLFIVHYTQGENGVGGGGSLEFFWVDGQGSVTFPQTGGGPSNPDRFGHGGIVSARGFNVAIVEPDAGATGLLLIVALACLGLARRLAA
jgi:hypothetical protein